jgi:hypothetical protein
MGANVVVQNASLIDFWTWAFSDLCDDDIKGIFAEWMVLKLLGIPTERRISWANSDVITRDKVRIEVKASSYWQSWKLLNEFGKPHTPPLYPVSKRRSDVTFAGLRARDATSVSDRSTNGALKSDIYVFAFQHEEEPELWNAMDLSQWEFYLLPVTRLEEMGWISVPLKKLRSEQEPMDALTFVTKAQQLIEKVAREKQSGA